MEKLTVSQFCVDLKNQMLHVHRQAILAYLNLHFCFSWLQIIADEAKPLRDFTCPINKLFFECKTDYHKPRNFCFELASNLHSTPFASNVIFSSDVTEYETVISFLRTLPKQKLSFLSPNLEDKHFLSFNFANHDLYIFDLHQLQTDVLFPALREKKYPLVRSDSNDSGTTWHSVNMLVPVDDIKHLSVFNTKQTAQQNIGTRGVLI